MASEVERTSLRGELEAVIAEAEALRNEGTITLTPDPNP